MSKLTDELEALVKRYSWNEHQPFFDDGQAHAFGRALQLAREHEATTGWRPIAEAPKNDEHYLCCDGEHYGWYEAHQEDWSYSGWVSSTTYAAVNPTHFLAVTTPPETKS